MSGAELAEPRETPCIERLLGVLMDLGQDFRSHSRSHERALDRAETGQGGPPRRDDRDPVLRPIRGPLPAPGANGPRPRCWPWAGGRPSSGLVHESHRARRRASQWSGPLVAGRDDSRAGRRSFSFAKRSRAWNASMPLLFSPAQV